MAACTVAFAATLIAGSAGGAPRDQQAAVRPVAAVVALPPPTPEECILRSGGRCVDPQQLAAAYGVTGLHARGITGTGVTVAIVDSFGSPTLRQDLAVYDATYHLPPLDLLVITPAGAPPPFDRANADMVGWAGETTLDVEVLHAIAPGARLLVVETPTSETEGLQGFPEIIKAENDVLAHQRADIITQSFAATEPTFDSPAQLRALSEQVYPLAKAKGVTVLSSSGDSGPTDVMVDLSTLFTRPTADWPASDPLVTAVGGTLLHIGPDGSRAAPDSAWGGQAGGGAAGGGRSDVFRRPAFQTSVATVVGDHRGVPDIALDASPASGLITYGTYAGRGWAVGGGTSQASPLLAGIVALADQLAAGRVGYLNDYLYGAASRGPAAGIVDVTRGSNDLVDAAGKRNPVPGYGATAGYDLATGLGTVNGAAFVPALAAARRGATVPLSAARATTAPTAASSASASATAPVTVSSQPVARSAGPAQPSVRPAAGGHASGGGSGRTVGLVAASVALGAAAIAGTAALLVTRRRRGAHGRS